MIFSMQHLRGRAAALYAACGRLRADRLGSVGFIFAMSVLPIMTMLALAIDYGANTSLQVRVQSALDVAVLAGANSSNPSTTSEQRIATATAAFNSAIGPDAGLITRVAFAVDPTTAEVTGNATATRPSQFSGIAPAFTKSVTSSALPTANLVRALDVALCVDATGSMSNTLSAVQTNISSFKTNLDKAITAAGYRPFDRTRVRVIYYRDFGGYGFINLPGYSWYAGYYGLNYPVTGKQLGDAQSLVTSTFYDMSSSNDLTSFKSFVSNQYATGGGDTPESGLECLWTAMKSSWTKVGDTLSNGKAVTDVYPVISIYTDAGAHPPNFTYSVKNPNYPAGMPTTFADLLAEWDSASVIDQTHKAILFYGNPTVEDDSFYGNKSGWETVKTWSGFSNPASLTSANNSFITSLAKGILGSGNIRLTH